MGASQATGGSAPGTFDYNERKYREATAGNEKGRSVADRTIDERGLIYGLLMLGLRYVQQETVSNKALKGLLWVHKM